MPDPALTHAGTILRRLDALAACTETPGSITRRFLTPAHAEAVALVRGWMDEAGLATALDASATLVGVRAGPTPGSPRLLLGSHIDTVRDAGRADGCLGVVLAIEAAGCLRGQSLPYALEIRAFGDEEGVRFPTTLIGSRAAAGRFDPAWLQQRDPDGMTLEQALRNFGMDPAALAAGACTAVGAAAYLEVHIEQGPVLEAACLPLGVVTSINGATRFDVTVTGRSGHAGTVPMNTRQDALAAASGMILAVQAAALARPGAVATVGRLTVAPNAANVIPGACFFSIDLRAPDDALRAAVDRDIAAAVAAIALDQRVGLSITRTHDAPAVACDPRLQALLANAVAAAGHRVLHLPSGAGHDAMALASLCPIGMLFVRCRGGISHHPDEDVSQPDVAAALSVLLSALETMKTAEFDNADGKYTQ